MTDNEIIKVLECCTNSLDCPADCPLYEYAGDCFLALHKPTLDLINRQKAEIERLKEQVNLWQEEAGSVGCANEWLRAYLKNAKAEAIKEFAERLKNNFPYKNACYTFEGIEYRIDNLVKEMVGEE